MSDKLNFIFLPLPWRRYEVDEAHRCRTMLEKIAFVFRHISSLQDRPEGFAERFFQHVFEKANVQAMSVEEYSKYQKDMTTELDRCAQLYTAKLEKAMEIAKKLLAEGVPYDVVKKCSGREDDVLNEIMDNKCIRIQTAVALRPATTKSVSPAEVSLLAKILLNGSAHLPYR